MHRFVRAEQHVLLLKRANTKHNLGAWGLPGGNVEAGDQSLLGTGEARHAGMEGCVAQSYQGRAVGFRHSPHPLARLTLRPPFSHASGA